MMHEKFLFLDTETVSTRYDGGIIQLSGCIEVDGELKETFDYMMSPFPECYLDENTLKFHQETNGWSEADIKSFTPPKEIFSEFTKLMKKYVDPFNKSDKFTIVGYNAWFDVEQLRAWWNLCGDKWYGAWFNAMPIDVLTILRFLLNKVLHTFPNMKLGTVYDCLKVMNLVDEVEGTNFHNALFDILVTREIFNKILLPSRGEFMQKVIKKLAERSSSGSSM